jgi:hypothetical protein
MHTLLINRCLRALEPIQQSLCKLNILIYYFYVFFIQTNIKYIWPKNNSQQFTCIHATFLLLITFSIEECRDVVKHKLNLNVKRLISSPKVIAPLYNDQNLALTSMDIEKY